MSGSMPAEHSKHPVIRMLCCGGLGNQMFQYAFARSVAHRVSGVVELDTATLFSRDHIYRRSYELDMFRLSDHITVMDQPVFMEKYRRRGAELLSKALPMDFRPFVAELRPLKYYKLYQEWHPRRNVTLLGYWQCARYFEPIASLLRTELTFSSALSVEDQALAARMEAEPSVAVHVRRKQYARTLGAEYYLQAIQHMRDRVPGATFYVFGDDPDWWHAREWGTDVQWVPGNARSGSEDFQLMASCRHFIIANSSFSWWAAWLSNQNGKHVISPGNRIWDNADTVPETWQQIPVDMDGEVM